MNQPVISRSVSVEIINFSLIVTQSLTYLGFILFTVSIKAVKKAVKKAVMKRYKTEVTSQVSFLNTNLNQLDFQTSPISGLQQNGSMNNSMFK